MITPNSSIHYKPTIERFTGFAQTYNESRPSPPLELIHKLKSLAGTERPNLVIDLGCGSGLSTRIWAEFARRVIGMDPAWDMLSLARQRIHMDNIEYIAALSAEVGLSDHCADIITCSQSLHWMEPFGTFSEVARILRPGGLFAAYDYDWPPQTRSDEVTKAYKVLMRRVHYIEEQIGISDIVPKWSKQQHMERMEASGVFHHVKELTFYHEELGSIDRLVQLIFSQGSIATLLKRGFTEDDLGISIFKGIVRHNLGSHPQPWVFCYRLYVGMI